MTFSKLSVIHINLVDIILTLVRISHLMVLNCYVFLETKFRDFDLFPLCSDMRVRLYDPCHFCHYKQPVHLYKN